MPETSNLKRPRIDWDEVAHSARRHAKEHPSWPEYVAPGLHHSSTVTQLRKRALLDGLPLNRWHLTVVRVGEVEKGKGVVVIRFFPKSLKGIYY